MLILSSLPSNPTSCYLFSLRQRFFLPFPPQSSIFGRRGREGQLEERFQSPEFLSGFQIHSCLKTTATFPLHERALPKLSRKRLIFKFPLGKVCLPPPLDGYQACRLHCKAKEKEKEALDCIQLSLESQLGPWKGFFFPPPASR